MKSIISLMAVASVAFFAHGQAVADLYKKICAGQSYIRLDDAGVN